MGRTARPKAGVAWEPPPSAERPNWPEIADELRSNPMKWMKVYENGRASWTTAIQLGHVAPVHRRLGFELTTTDNTRDTPRTCTLFMRYNPGLVDEVAEIVTRKD